MKPPTQEREVLYESLVSGDRTSIMTLGVFGAASIKKSKMAVFMVDVLGRVHVMPTASVQVIAPPRLTDEELDGYIEDESIGLMLKQGSEEEEILAYLKRRKER